MEVDPRSTAAGIDLFFGSSTASHFFYRSSQRNRADLLHQWNLQGCSLRKPIAYTRGSDINAVTSRIRLHPNLAGDHPLSEYGRARLLLPVPRWYENAPDFCSV